MTSSVEQARVEVHDPLAGTCFRALRRIGGGSASDVFAAVGPRGERRAVKVLRALYAEASEIVWRLEQEGRALASLDHPNVVPIVGAGITAGGRPYLVMPLLVGETLRDRMRREGKLAVDAVVPRVLDALDGLAAAHDRGIVHRDVKPANVFLARGAGGAERGVMLDFGIAKLGDATYAPASGGHVLGTPRYLAPEQILGGAVDARTDVYAVGVVLFEALAGRPPFAGLDPMETMRAHLEDRAPSLARIAGAHPMLDAVVARCLAKSPGDRWDGAGSLADALSAVTGHARGEDAR
jgi:serine/threonine-protein kinase